ncbi:MAG: aldo/keto reductase [Planctomycetes bacterium]|nr:aldo/keto reductase [Planctomycetota bacterium]
MASIEKRPLGRTNRNVSRLGLGGHTFLRRFGGADRPDENTLTDILRETLDSGINLLDATYDEERELLGAHLRNLGRRDRALVSCWAQAKCTPTGAATLAECERALKQFGLEQLDHFYLEVDCTDEHARALDQLKRDGKIRCAGLLGVERALAAGPQKIDAAVGVYNFYRPDAAKAFAALHAQGIGTIGVEPLGRGRFIRESPQAAARIVSALLRFALANADLDSVLVTMTSLEQVRANAATAASQTPLSPEDRALLNAGRGYEIPFDPWK